MSTHCLGATEFWNPKIAKAEVEKLRLLLAKKRDAARQALERFVKPESELFHAWANYTHLRGMQCRKNSAVVKVLQKGFVSDPVQIQAEVFKLWSGENPKKKFQKKALAMMAGKETKLLVEEIFRTWSTYVQDGSAKMRRAQGCMTALIGGQARLMRQNVWKGWCDVLQEAHDEAMMGSMMKELEAAKLKEDESLRKALAAMSSGDAKIVTKNTFIAWTQHLENLRKDKINERRMLMVMLNNDATALSAGMFQAWSSLVAEDRKKHQAHLRTLAAFANGNTRFLMTEGFNVFVKAREDAIRKRQQDTASDLEGAFAVANEALARARERSLASMRRMCAQLAGACVGAFFGVWIQAITDARGSSELAERLAYEESKRHTSQLQAAQAMMGKTGKMWQTRCLAAWIKDHHAMAHEKAMEMTSVGRKDQAHRVMGLFAGQKTRVLLTGIVTNWRRIAQSSSGWRNMDEIREAHREEKDMLMLKANARTFIWAQRLLARITSQDRTSTLRQFLQVWRATTSANNAAGKERTLRVLTKALEGNDALMVPMTFMLWRTYAGAHNNDTFPVTSPLPTNPSWYTLNISHALRNPTPPVSNRSAATYKVRHDHVGLQRITSSTSTQCSSGATTPTIPSQSISAPQFGRLSSGTVNSQFWPVPNNGMNNAAPFLRSVTPPPGWRL